MKLVQMLALVMLLPTVSQATFPLVLLEEDFQSGFSAWTLRHYAPTRPYDPDRDMPSTFATDDPLLYENISNPGTQSVGYTSNTPFVGSEGTKAAWLQQQFPAAVAPGTYQVNIELDLYVYADPSVYSPGNPDPYAIGNRLFLLSDEYYDNWGWNFDVIPLPSTAIVRKSYWPGTVDGYVDWSLNGVWQHIVIQGEFTTATGNLEFRLLKHYKRGGAQAVAWDNITVTLTPEPTTGLMLLLPMLGLRCRHRMC